MQCYIFLSNIIFISHGLNVNSVGFDTNLINMDKQTYANELDKFWTTDVNNVNAPSIHLIIVRDFIISIYLRNIA